MLRDGWPCSSLRRGVEGVCWWRIAFLPTAYRVGTEFILVAGNQWMRSYRWSSFGQMGKWRAERPLAGAGGKGRERAYRWAILRTAPMMR